MKTYNIVGRVEAVSGQRAAVLLMNKITGEVLESACETTRLAEAGLSVGDEFQVNIKTSQDGRDTVELVRIPPKQLSAERIQEIRDSVKHIQL